MDLHLRDLVAVVTGGASGIGAATVRALAAEGCRVAIWDLRVDDRLADHLQIAAISRIQAAWQMHCKRPKNYWAPWILLSMQPPSDRDISAFHLRMCHQMRGYEFWKSTSWEW